jgi:Response regulator containing a CheY-like receiver domain and an HD-GYP domain
MLKYEMCQKLFLKNKSLINRGTYHMSDNSEQLVLLVDDVPKNLQILGTTLKSEDLTVAFATNGKKAIEYIQKNCQT